MVRPTAYESEIPDSVRFTDVWFGGTKIKTI